MKIIGKIITCYEGITGAIDYLSLVRDEYVNSSGVKNAYYLNLSSYW
jgi:hypothetical protein